MTRSEVALATQSPTSKVVKITLDEAQFCRKCYPDVKQPQLGLVVQRADTHALHRVTGITLEDLRLIAEFLAGKANHVLPDGTGKPL